MLMDIIATVTVTVVFDLKDMICIKSYGLGSNEAGGSCKPLALNLTKRLKLSSPLRRLKLSVVMQSL